MNEKDGFEIENRINDPMNYSASLSANWQFTGANPTNESVGFISSQNPSTVENGNLGVSSCPSTSMANSFSPTIWDLRNSTSNTGFCNFSGQNSTRASNVNEIERGGQNSLRSSIDRTLDMAWNQQNPLMKGVFPANVPVLPSSFSQIPADSGFIERAARFSCFNGGNFTDMVGHFGISQSPLPHSQGAVPMSGRQVLRSEASKDVSLSMELEATENNLPKDEGESERAQERETLGGDGESGNESDEAGFSGSGGGGGRDERGPVEGAVGRPSNGELSFKKRKRGGQNTKFGQSKEAASQKIGGTSKDGALNQRKGEPNPNKPTGKQGKQDSKASDAPKEEYIHVRARRGQATNSHSLAERVRREKISERMRLLQDLVPGCSKVTGKAVMLDEIINYVQSLQRQVEFLSMKLATVNPGLDFNIEGLLTKDIIQSRGGPSSFGFPPELPMPYMPQHPSHLGLVPPNLLNTGSPSDLLRRTINSQLSSLVGGFKEPVQLANVWEEGLHNVVPMNFDAAAPSDSQDV